MDTLHLPATGRRRRYHSPEFKTQIVMACLQPGVSISFIAVANQLNPNLVRQWIRRHQRSDEEQHASRNVTVPGQAGHPAPTLVPVCVADSSVQTTQPASANAGILSKLPPLPPSHLPPPSLPMSPQAEPIRLEWRRGDILLNLAWPASQSESCIRLLRELLQ